MTTNERAPWRWSPGSVLYEHAGQLHAPDAEVIDPGDTDVLLALVRVYLRDGRATVRSVLDECGHYSSTSSVQAALDRLRHEGLVSNEGSHVGSLRPLLGILVKQEPYDPPELGRVRRVI